MAELPVFPFETPPDPDTDPELARLRVSDPVPKDRLAPGGEAWLVTRYDDAKRVFAEPTFSRAEAVKPGVPSLRPARQNPYLLVSMDPRSTPGSANSSPPPSPNAASNACAPAFKRGSIR